MDEATNLAITLNRPGNAHPQASVFRRNDGTWVRFCSIRDTPADVSAALEALEEALKRHHGA